MMYGIEAAEIAPQRIAQVAANVIDVFRSKHDKHNDTLFFATLTEAKNDLDPVVQIATRRILQMRRTAAKQEGTEERYKQLIKAYAKQALLFKTEKHQKYCFV